MRLLLATFILGLALSVSGQGLSIHNVSYLAASKPKVAGGGSSPTYLFAEDFEGTGYENAGWTEGGNNSYVVDEDYSAAPLDGNQSLSIELPTSLGFAYYSGLNAGGDFDVYFRMNLPSGDIGSSRYLLIGYTNSTTSTYLFRFTGTTANKALMRSGTVNSTNSATALALSTTYHVWISHHSGSGSDSWSSVGFSTDGTRPTAGDPNFTMAVNGNAIGSLDTIRFGTAVGAGNATWTNIIDKIRVSTSTIGSNPE